MLRVAVSVNGKLVDQGPCWFQWLGLILPDWVSIGILHPLYMLSPNFHVISSSFSNLYNISNGLMSWICHLGAKHMVESGIIFIL